MKQQIRLTLAGLVCLAASYANAAAPLVDTEWVKSNIGKPGIVFLDVRSSLANKSKKDYLEAHIPGAVYTDYLKGGWRAKDNNGTPGQLAPVDKLEKLIGDLGIDNDTHVVVIPNGANALEMGTGTRIYWTFKVLGHDNVSLLNGGMTDYLAAIDEKTKKPLNPLQSGDVKPEAKTFKATFRPEMIASKSDVIEARQNNITIVDNRPYDQFMGLSTHKKAKRLGTIPGAVSLPESWMMVRGGGKILSTPALSKLYQAANVETSGKQINFCNTGHWASLGWFVSHELMGNKDALMYDGSMLEWSADQSLPIEQKIKLE